MAQPTPSPELAQAYRLIKAGDRKAAGQVLRDYLKQHPQDTDAWWLMAHAVDQAENMRKCLERILQIDPGHARARERLAQLRIAVPLPETSPPLEEPDEQMILQGIRPADRRASKPRPPSPPPSRPPSRPAPLPPMPSAPPPSGPPPAPGSFEAFVATANAGLDPFTPADADPFAGIDPNASPFSGLPVSGAIAVEGVASAPAAPRGGRTAFDQAIAVAVLIFSALVLIGVVLFALDKRGTIRFLPDLGPGSYDTLQASTFAIDYPRGWDQRCLTEGLGYPVCGIANHAFYNEVDTFAGQQIDIASMLNALFSGGMIGTVPDEQISIIVMDVPRNSLSYDNRSWAKTQYEMYQSGWRLDPAAEVTYARQEIIVDGRQAYYYAYTNVGIWKEAAWDVYIEHDGIVFWMRATFYGDRGDRIPQRIIDRMIDSLDLDARP